MLGGEEFLLLKPTASFANGGGNGNRFYRRSRPGPSRSAPPPGAHAPASEAVTRFD